MRRLVEGALVVLCAGSAYQLAVAAKLLDLGDEPGDGPPLDGLFFVVPLCVLLLGGAALVLTALARGGAATLSRRLSFQALPVAAAAFPLSRAAAFDPYYLPTLERFRGVGLVWVTALAVVAAAAALLSRRRPGPPAVALTGLVMVASGLLAIGQGLH